MSLSIDFVEAICKAGGEFYVVGGAVRNYFYNKIHCPKIKLEIKDKDTIVRNIDSISLLNILKSFGTVKEVGQNFGVIKFKPSHGYWKTEIDIALPRTEKSTGSGYKNFKITSDYTLSLENDFKRRDATINSLAIRIYNINQLKSNTYENNQVIDYFGGMNDLESKIWKAVGDPFDRFVEDPTRIMRALRQCSEMDLTLEEKTKESISKNYILLEEIKKESIVRITEELVRLLKGESCCRILEFMRDIKLMDFLDLSKNIFNIEKCMTRDANIRIRVAMILDSHIRESVLWVKEYQLSAAPHYSKYDVNFILCVNTFFQDLEYINVPFDDSHPNQDNYLMKKLLQSAEKQFPNYARTYISDLIKYYCIVTNQSEKKLRALFESNRCTILTPSQLRLDGLTIINLFPTVFGKGIKIFKEILFEDVTRNLVKNNKDDLIAYAKKNDITKLIF